MVIHFCMCEIIKKCIKTSTNMALYLEKDLKASERLRLVSCEVVGGGLSDVFRVLYHQMGVAQGERRSLEEGPCACVPFVSSYLFVHLGA